MNCAIVSRVPALRLAPRRAPRWAITDLIRASIGSRRSIIATTTTTSIVETAVPTSIAISIDRPSIASRLLDLELGHARHHEDAQRLGADRGTEQDLSARVGEQSRGIIGV